MEVYVPPRETLEHSQQPATQLIVATLRQLATDPETSKGAEKDPVSRALYKAMLCQSLDSPFSKAVHEMAPIRLRSMGATALTADLPNHGNSTGLNGSDGNTSEIAGILRSATTTFLRGYLPDFSDQTLTDTGAWAEPMTALNEALHYDRYNEHVIQFDTNLKIRKIATNHPGRYMPVELILQALRPRFPNGVNQADFGSSAGAGVNWQFRKNEKSGRLSPMEFERVTSFAPREDLTARANQLLARLPLLRKSVEIDLQVIYHNGRQMYDPGFIDWVEGSFRASERHNTQFMNQFRELVRYKPDGVDFFWGDLLMDQHLDHFRQAYPEPFDVFIINTALHQNPTSMRNKLLNIALDSVHEEGVVIVQEFAYLSPNSRKGPVPITSLRTRDYWHRPHYYGTYIIDKAHPKLGFQEVAKFEDNSRCSRAMIMPATVFLDNDNTEYPFRDIIANA